MEKEQNKGLQVVALILIALAVIWTGYVFYKTGTKYIGTDGDAFNGMAGPVISLVGAVLVYLSFQQQYEANKIQKTALTQTLQQNIKLKNYDVLLDDIKTLENRISNFSYELFDTGPDIETVQGHAAIIQVIDKFIKYWEERSGDAYSGEISESKLAELVALFMRVRNIYEGIDVSDLEEKHKTELRNRADILLFEQLAPVFKDWNNIELVHTHLANYHKEDYLKEMSTALLDEHSRVEKLYLERVEFKGEITL